MPRELIDTGTEKRFVRRDDKGQFHTSVDGGRSLAADKRHDADKKGELGDGDRGSMNWTDALNSHSRVWDATDVEQLSSLLRDGKDIPQVAHTLGRSQEAVRTKARALGLHSKRGSGRLLVQLDMGEASREQGFRENGGR